MLDYMRKNSGSLFVWLIIGAIAMVFVFFGVGGGGGRSQVITVNGEEVNPAVYERALRNVARFRANLGDSPDVERELKTMAVSQVVNMTLNMQFGRGVGLTPSDKAVGDKIVSDPMFQVDGRFSRGLYDEFLNNIHTKPTAYEASTREELLIGRASAFVESMAFVFEPEAREFYRFFEDKMQLDYVFFPSAPYRESLKVSDEMLQAFYQFNQEKWRKPAAIKLEFAAIKPADYLDQVKLTEEEVQDYYKENAQRFTQPETAEVSHILFKFPSLTPSEEERQATLAKAEAAYERAKDEDFAALAKELSEDPTSAADGGKWGDLAKGSTFASFEEAAFNLPLNEVSRPVQTDLGYHLVKVEARHEAAASPLEKIRPTLEGELKVFKAREMAVAKLEDLIVRSETNPKLAEAAASMGLKAEATELFEATAAPEFFEGDLQEIQRAFAAPVGKVGVPVEKDDYLALYVPLERRDSFIPPLEEVKDAVMDAWVNQEAARLAKVKTESFIKQAQEKGWQGAIEAEKPEDFQRGDTELGQRGAILSSAVFSQADPLEMEAAVFSVAATGDIVPTTVLGEYDGQPGCFALFVTKFEKADETGLEGAGGELFKSLLSAAKAGVTLQAWNNELYELSRNSINVPRVYID